MLPRLPAASASLLPFLGLTLLLVGCAQVELVRPPARSADLYPAAESRGGMTVAIDVVADERQGRYFGRDLVKAGLVPIQIVVSNRGEGRMRISPADVLLMRGPQVVDPVPLERVTGVVKRGVPLSSATARDLDGFFESLAFKETILAPGQSSQGFLFFPRETKKERRSSFRIVPLFSRPNSWLHVLATDLERKERIRFGPIGLSS